MREMKINKIAIGSIFVLGLSLLSTPAYAEEVVEEAPVVEESPAPEPTPEPEYVPPPEASEGIGGWAVVDPETGNVHGVIVGSIETFNSRNGTIGHEYMGCHSDCVLRFQTRATADGNVAGWHGSDGSVRWNANENNFSINQQNGDSSYSATLVPERTARDEAGMDLHTGLVQRQSNNKTSEGIEIKQVQEDYLDEEVQTDILFPEWGQGGKLFSYGSEIAAEEGIEQDVNNELVEEGYTTETEDTQEIAIDEENEFVKTVRVWTESVINFFRGIFS
jgi:hypothetical protein